MDEFLVPLVAEGLSPDEIELAVTSLRSGRHTMGSSVSKFEDLFANFVGAHGAVMVNSGSSANLLALEAVIRGLSKSTSRQYRAGDLIAVPAILWPTTLWPIVQLGLTPILIDTKPESLEMDLNQLVEAKIMFGQKLVGVFAIHPLGKCLEIERLAEICNTYDMFLVEDTCESLGAGQNRKAAGTIGIAGTYSFYYSHHITTIEGGMVVSNDLEFLDDLRSMRAHGWTRNRNDKGNWLNEQREFGEDFLFVTSGFNFRPMEIQGILGISQLSAFPTFLSKRIKNAIRIKRAIEDSSLKLIGDQTLDRFTIENGLSENSWMTFPLLCDPRSHDKNDVELQFRSMGIATRPIIAGSFWDQPAFRTSKIEIFRDFPNARFITSNGFMIGNHHSFSESQVLRICEAIRRIKNV